MFHQSGSSIHFRINAVTAAILASLITVLFMASSASAAPSARNFFSPTFLDQPLAFCSQDGKNCGKPVATAWCKHKGYDEALNYARKNPAPDLDLIFADTGNTCVSGQCIAFRQIKCMKGATQ